MSIGVNLFEVELERSIKHCGLFGFKLATPRASDARFVAKVPYDFHVFGRGTHAALEAKQILHGSYLSFDRIRDHQEQSLLEVAARGGGAYVIVRCQEKGQKDPSVYALPIHLWMGERRNMTARNAKGVHVNRVDGAVKVPLIDVYTTCLWDLRVLLQC